MVESEEFVYFKLSGFINVLMQPQALLTHDPVNTKPRSFFSF